MIHQRVLLRYDDTIEGDTIVVEGDSVASIRSKEIKVVDHMIEGDHSIDSKGNGSWAHNLQR
jgi:hypothetical protein